MNKKELVEFLNENYADEDVLMWQTISKSDLEMMGAGEDIPDDKWEDFVEQHSEGLAEEFSAEARLLGMDFFEESN